jgi:phytoene synthase
MTPESRDEAACGAAIRHGSQSFHAAFLPLPSRVRRAAPALYAFCRMADDAVDLHEHEAAAVKRLRARLAPVYDGRPANAPSDRAFARILGRHALPAALPAGLPEALIKGFEWDAEGRRHADLSALKDYATRVAGTVGAMMAVLMDVRDPAPIARACDLGVAMQLTNIARDVGEDAAEGRLCLPLDLLAQVGIDPEAFLADPKPSLALASVVARLLAEADALYLRVESGLAAPPGDVRGALHPCGHRPRGGARGP